MKKYLLLFLVSLLFTVCSIEDLVDDSDIATDIEFEDVIGACITTKKYTETGLVEKTCKNDIDENSCTSLFDSDSYTRSFKFYKDKKCTSVDFTKECTDIYGDIYYVLTEDSCLE